MMTWLLIVLFLVVGIVLLDRLLLACERRGWIYYRRAPRPWGTGMGNAIQEMETFYRPSQRHVIEQRIDEEVQREDDDEGGAGSTAGAGRR